MKNAFYRLQLTAFGVFIPSLTSQSLLSHSLFKTLLRLRGNPRACVYTEPLWGIPFNLYAPYASVYMLALGLRDSQIGLIATIGMVFQIFFTILGGPLTDKLGRKRATLIFDMISWSGATVVWAIAQDFNYFLLAAVLNAAWRVPMTSWTCLLVEDADPKDLVDIYSWVNIAGLLAAFFAPVAGVLISVYTLVPTMRGLYWLAFALMTIKFVVLNITATETAQGVVRMQQTKDQSLFSMLTEYRGVFGIILRTPKTLYTLGIMLVMSITSLAGGTFWSILATEKIGIPTENLALFPFARSIIMLIFFFLVMPRIREMHFRQPMLLGFGLLMISQLLLITAPYQSYVSLLISVFLDACSLAVVSTLRDKLIVVNVDTHERARIMSLMYLVVIVFSSPFGWIAGMLSEANKILPFVLSMALYGVGLGLTYLASRAPRETETAG